MKLIVGKWYKLPHTSNFICKYKAKNRCSEYITNNGQYISNGGGCDFKDAIIVSLEELKKYLPKNYKFNEEIEYEIY